MHRRGTEKIFEQYITKNGSFDCSGLISGIGESSPATAGQRFLPDLLFLLRIQKAAIYCNDGLCSAYVKFMA